MVLLKIPPSRTRGQGRIKMKRGPRLLYLPIPENDWTDDHRMHIGFFSFSAFLGENVLFNIPTELSKTPFTGG